VIAPGAAALIISNNLTLKDMIFIGLSAD